jgi:hypothetical protein
MAYGLRRHARWARVCAAVAGGLWFVFFTLVTGVGVHDYVTRFDRYCAYFGLPPGVADRARVSARGEGIEIDLDWDAARSLTRQCSEYSGWYENRAGLFFQSGGEDISIPASPEIWSNLSSDNHRGRIKLLVYDRQSGLLTALKCSSLGG